MKPFEANISLSDFEQLFRTHYKELCGFANKYLDDIDASEETVQGIFVRLWENRSSTQIKGSIRSYLFSSVKNGCLNQLKHIKVREDYKAHNQREMDMNASHTDENYEANELEKKINDSIEALPEARRKIFILSRYEGLKYKEIAEKLNISVKTVENQMGSAIKQLRTDLVEYITILTILMINIWR